MIENEKNQFEKIYKKMFVGRTLTKLDIIMIHDEYLEYEEGKVWLTEGGVELRFEEGNNIALSYEQDPIQFLCVESDLLPFVAEFDYYPIEIESDDYFSLIEEEIEDVEVTWIKQIETDYKGDVHSEEEFPIQFLLKFKNGSILQIASVLSSIVADSGEFKSIRYSLEGTILISINRIFEIEMP